MDKNPEIKKCKTCGTILSPKDRFKRVLSESEEALERYYNRHLRSKK